MISYAQIIEFFFNRDICSQYRQDQEMCCAILLALLPCMRCLRSLQCPSRQEEEMDHVQGMLLKVLSGFWWVKTQTNVNIVMITITLPTFKVRGSIPTFAVCVWSLHVLLVLQRFPLDNSGFFLQCKDMSKADWRL